MLKRVLNECLDYIYYCLKVKNNMNHLLFTFKNINVKVRILVNITEKLKRYTIKMICTFTSDSIRVQKLVANGCFENVP